MGRLDGWDLDRYRKILRQRAATLHIDPRVHVRFDESDLVQETLLRAADPNLAPCEGMTDHERLAWLIKVQSRVLLDKYDEQFSQKRDVTKEAGFEPFQRALFESTIDFVEQAEGEGPRPPDEAARREEVAILDDLLAQLSPEYQRVLELRRQGATLAQIAATLGETVGVIASRVAQATKALTKLSRQFRENRNDEPGP